MSLISSLSNPGILWFSSIIIAIICSCLKMSFLLYTWLLYPLITPDSFVLAVSHINCKFLDMILLLSFLARYHDAKPEVLMQLTSSYCTHLYGSQAWQLMTQMCIECLPHGIKQLEEFGISQHILIECFCVG